MILYLFFQKVCNVLATRTNPCVPFGNTSFCKPECDGGVLDIGSELLIGESIAIPVGSLYSHTRKYPLGQL